MKIDESTVKKIRITEIERLDPVNVFIEDFSKGVGKITIECYGKSWVAFWPRMGSRTVSEFFCSCDNCYIIGKLDSSLKAHIRDDDNLSEFLKSKIKERRFEGYLTKEQARELYERADYGIDQVEGNEDLFYAICGEEWLYDLPMTENPGYLYLSRIVDTVKEALKIT